MSEASQPEPLSREDTALLIRALWESLLTPTWKKDDLIDLGKLVYAKVPLKEIDGDAFARLLPHLNTIAQSLGKRILGAPAPFTKTALPPTTPPAPTPTPATPTPPAPATTPATPMPPAPAATPATAIPTPTPATATKILLNSRYGKVAESPHKQEMLINPDEIDRDAMQMLQPGVTPAATVPTTTPAAAVPTTTSPKEDDDGR